MATPALSPSPPRARAVLRTAMSVCLALAIPSVAIVPLAAAGEPAKTRSAKPAGDKSASDPENVTAISPFMQAIAKGSEHFLAKENTAAIDAYKKAVQLSPRNAVGHYLLAEAYLVAGNLSEADAAIAQAAEVADAKNPALRARVLFLTADIRERQKKWPEAKLAWQVYAEQAAKVPGGTDAGAYPQSAAERLKTMQRVLDMEKAYATVRERIAAEKANAGKSKKP